MAICTNCGTQLQDGVKFCPSCGQTQAAEPAQGAAQQAYAPPVVPGAPEQADIQDAQDNKMMAILAYIIFFIPLLTGAYKTSPFAKFHTNQGTVLAIASVAYGIAYGILTAILAFIPVIGWLLILLLGLASFIIPIFCILGIINAVNGKMKPLPLVGGITIIK
jgi:uncharacterized membrane protein